MPYLKRLLLLMLLVCTVSTSSAWAFDVHMADDAFHTSDVSALSDESSGQLKDHCGHLSAHLVGLFTEVNFQLNANSFFMNAQFTKYFISFVPQVYLRPPIV